MKPNEMRDACESAVKNDARVTLVFPVKGKLPYRFPRGELLGESTRHDGTDIRVYSYEPKKIIRWLNKFVYLLGDAK